MPSPAITLTKYSGKSKVAKFYNSIFCDKNIFWFNITMNALKRQFKYHKNQIANEYSLQQQHSISKTDTYIMLMTIMNSMERLPNYLLDCQFIHPD